MNAMKIKLKMFATLGEFLPPGAKDNQIEIEVPDEATPQSVIDRFRIPPELSHLVLINGVYLSPEQRNERVLRAGEVLAVFPPVAGG